MTRTTGMALVIRGDARNLPLPDESVDLIATSPPYFALRSYRDAGQHYDGQIGSEPTPQAFLEALWECTREWWRVLKPTGSLFVNLGDKRSGSGGHNNAMGSGGPITLNGQGGPKLPAAAALAHLDHEQVRATRRNAPDRYNQEAFGRSKSKMLLPHRYAIGCEDGLADPEGIGWIVRQDQVWHKLNGLPESVTDRTRDQHEYWFQLTKQARYFSAIDELREPSQIVFDADQDGTNHHSRAMSNGQGHHVYDERTNNPLGKGPGSVTAMPSEPLIISEEVRKFYDLPDHFAAFPQEWPRRLILGWSPSGICVNCGEGRRPMIEADRVNGQAPMGGYRGTVSYAVSGYACACTPYTDHAREGSSPLPSGTAIAGRNSSPTWSQFAEGPRGGRIGPWREFHLDGWEAPPTRPAIICDPFGGTGTVAGVARSLGRIGISVDLSWDYSRLAKWRIFRSGHFAKTEERTHRDRAMTLF